MKSTALILAMTSFFVLIIPLAVDAQDYEVRVYRPETGGGWGFPGGEVVHTYTVENVGTRRDSYVIDATSQHNWNVTIEGDAVQFSLAPGERRSIDVAVEIPDDARAEASDDLTVTASSPNGSLDSNRSVTRVYRVAGVEIQPVTGTTSGPPGEEVFLDFRIYNRGNAEDNFTLVVEVTDSDYRTWTSNVDDRTGDLGPDEYEVVRVTVMIPSSRSGDIVLSNTQATVKITASSSWDPSIQDLGYSTIRVEEAYGVDIRLLSPNGQIVEKGGAVNYLVEVTNVANFESSDRIVLRNSTTPENWIVVLDRTGLNLKNGENGTVLVTVSAPPESEERRCDVIIIASSSKDRDKNDTIVITTFLPQEYGVDVSPLPPQSLSGVPGETLSYSFLITNTGNGRDAISLHATSQHGWVTKSPSSVILEKDASIEVTVNVTVGEGTPAGTKDILTLFAVCGDDTTSDSAYVVTYVLQGFGVHLDPAYNTSSVGPGEDAIFTFTVTNTGNGNDTIAIALDRPSNWSTRFDPSYPVFMLRPGESHDFDLIITPPENESAQSTETVWINATSSGDPSAYAISRAYVVVTQVAGVRLENASKARGDPGSYAVVNFTLTNAGNGVDSFELVVTSFSEWETSIINPNAGKDLRPEEHRIVQVRVFIPPKTSANYTEVISLTATSKFDKDVRDEARGICIVNLVTGVSLHSDAGVATAIPNHPVSISIEVRNTGNGREEVDLSVDPPSENGWLAVVDHARVVMNAGEKVYIYMRVTPPSDAYGMSKSFRLIAKPAEGGEGDELSVMVRCSFIMATGDSVLHVMPGGDVIFEVLVMNVFLTTDVVGLNYNLSAGGDWSVQAPSSITLDPGEVRSLYVSVSAPVTQPDNSSQTVTVLAEFSANFASDTVDLTAVCFAPDIILKSVSVRGRAVEGSIVEIRVEVQAKGHATGDPDIDILRDIRIEIFYEEDLIDTWMVSDLQVGSSKVEFFSLRIPHLNWDSKEEDHVISAKIVENRYENTKSLTNNVNSEKVRVLDGTEASLALLPIIILIAISVLAYRMNRRRISPHQRKIEALITGVVIALLFALLYHLPISGDLGRIYGASVLAVYFLIVLPLFVAYASGRAKSLVLGAILSLSMFFLCFILVVLGTPDPYYLIDVLTTQPLSALPLDFIPVGFYLLLSMIIALSVSYGALRFWLSAKEEYEAAKMFIEQVKGGMYYGRGYRY